VYTIAAGRLSENLDIKSMQDTQWSPQSQTKKSFTLHKAFKPHPLQLTRVFPTNVLLKYRMAVSHGLFEDAYHMRIYLLSVGLMEPLI